MTRRCDKCEWSDLSDDGRICRRYPPSTGCYDEGGMSDFPLVADDGWCGEFQQKAPAEPVYVAVTSGAHCTTSPR